MNELEKAIVRYNGIMNATCYEHLTIGTDYSENTENYGYQEMVEECEYLLSTYYEGGHVNEELRRDDNKLWCSHTAKLKRFIAKYKGFCKSTQSS